MPSPFTITLGGAPPQPMASWIGSQGAAAHPKKRGAWCPWINCHQKHTAHWYVHVPRAVLMEYMCQEPVVVCYEIAAYLICDCITY